MAAFKQKAFLSGYKRRIRKKLDDIVEEAENVCSVIQELTSKVKEETTDILEENDDTFFANYSLVQSKLENFSEKLFLALNVITSVEECSKEEEPKEEKPKKSETKITVDCRDAYQSTSSASESHKETSSQASDISPSTDSGICVQSLSSSSKETENKSTVSSKVNSQSDLIFISDDSESCSSTDAENVETNSSVHDNKDSSFTSFVSQDAVSLLGDCTPQVTHIQIREQSFSELNTTQSTLMNKELSILSSSSAHSFESANSHIDMSFKSVPSPKNYTYYHDLPPQDIPFGITFSAPITASHNPSDFWLQLGNSVEKILESYTFAPLNLSDVKTVKYCIALQQRSNSYQRAEILSVFGDGSHMRAQVNFIDFGYIDIVQASELKVMPMLLYAYPRQAIRCFLYGVSPKEHIWSKAALKYFNEIKSYSDLQAVVLFKQGIMFAVQLTVMLPMLEEREPCDIANMLCILNFAVATDELTYSHSSDVNSQSTVCDIEKSNDNSYENVKDATAYDFGALDVNSPALHAYKLSSPSEKESSMVMQDSPAADDHLVSKLGSPVCKGNYEIDSPACRGIYQGSASSGHSESENDSVEDFASLSNEKFSSTSEQWDLDAMVPSLHPFFLDNDLMIVIPSVIYSPSYFFCNAAMGNPLELDELRELMTKAYENLNSPNLKLCDIKEGMYLACPFDDGWWYRVQVVQICDVESGRDEPEVLVFFIDYGNEKVVSVKDLKPLRTKFAKYPVMGIFCSLAYIQPKSMNELNESSENSPKHMKWDQRSIDRFVELTNKEKPLTAQVSQYPNERKNRVFEVFLWDVGETGDRMINDILVDEGFAKYSNISIIPKLLKSYPDEKQPEDAQALNQWDPMKEHYESITNSYGVDETDPEISTVGYKAGDESYICKFYAANEKCYRGDSCPYKHISPGYRDETVDQELVFAGENEAILPNEGTYCLVHVSCIRNAGHFYVVFPFGVGPLVETAYNTGGSLTEQTEYSHLAAAMNEYYNKSPFDENTAIALACGSIVAAKTKFDGHWYRARIREVDDVDKPVEVFYIDFGNIEWVDRRNIRQMQQRFMHCPAQAVEAFLANVDPIAGKDDSRWSTKATLAFEKLVRGKILLAYINRKIGSVLFLTLKLTEKSNTSEINNLLIQEGFARYSNFSSGENNTSTTVNREMCVYVPA